MPRGLDSSVPPKGFGPSKDGQGFGKIARQHQAVMGHVRGLPDRLLPTMAAEEDLAAVQQLIKASGETAKRRRRRKQNKDSEGAGESAQQHVERSKSTPPINRGPSNGAIGGAAADAKPRKRRHRTPEPEPLTRRQFEVACESLHLPAVPGAQRRPGQPAAGVWFDQLPRSDKLAMRRVLERNGARAAIIVAELPEHTEKSVESRVKTRLSAEKDAFQVLLDRNRRVRAENGRMSNGRSRRARLLDPLDSASEEEDTPREHSPTDGSLAALSEGEKLSLLMGSVTRFTHKDIVEQAIDTSILPEDEEDLENYKMAQMQIEARKTAMHLIDEELPDIGEEDSASGGFAADNVAPAEAILQWIDKVKELMGKNDHTLNLPYYGMGEGGSAALVAAIATIEGLDLADLVAHEEVPEPSHVFRKLILKSNALAPSKEQSAAAVAEANSSTTMSPEAIEKKLRRMKQTGTQPQGQADQTVVVDFATQAKDLRKAKQLKYMEAAFTIQRAYRRSSGKSREHSRWSTIGGAEPAPPKTLSGVDNIGVLLSLYVGEIQNLDLSDNPLGVAGGQIIASSLDGHCPVKLKKLVLEGCNLTDRAAGSIIAVLSEQTPALSSLNLRNNGLGNDQRGDRGASAALHNLLVEGCCDLQVLRLGYNNLRPQHLRHIYPALQQKCSLVYLGLAWNSLGNDGAMWLAHGLRKNTTMRAVDLTHNEIKEKGCFVIADMLKEPTHLEHIVLDENPIGERGARAILRTIRKVIIFGWTRHISFDKCNMQYIDQEKIFDPQEAGGPHVCSLGDPYGRSVAWSLVELAWDEDGENWIGEKYDGKPYDLEEPPPGEIWTRERFQLPETGELSLTYFSTMRQARYKDVVEDEMVHQLLILMSSKNVTDGGVTLLKLAAKEFFFTASMVGNLICLMKDNVSRMQIACALIPRIVDHVNLIAQTYCMLTDGEIANIEKNMGKLFHFNPANPTGHYALQLANSFDRVLIRRLAEITEEQGAFRREQGMLDTSQKGDW